MIQPIPEAIQAWLAILYNLPTPIHALMALSVVMFFFIKIVNSIFHARS